MDMELTLRNVKIAQHLSQETTAYTGTVYIDGKKAGNVRNDGHGGSDIVDWTDYGLSAAYLEWLKAEPMPRPDVNDPEKVWLVEPEWKLEIVLGEALAKFEEQQWFKTKCRKKTVFRLTTDEGEDSWRIVNAPFSAAVKAWLTTRYGDTLGEIANETRI
jgi:hypothetical protein